MKLINRIMLSSTLLILLSLMLFLIGAVLLLSLFVPAVPERVVMDKDVLTVEKILSDFQSRSEAWESLDTMLSEYGYRLLVMIEKETVYSSLDEWENFSKNLKPLELSENVTVGYMENTYFVAKSYGKDSVFAVRRTGENRNNFLGFLPSFLVSLLLFVALIVLLGRFFTRKMAWRILRPLDELTGAAKRIEDGDLSIPIIYVGNDEFSSVCSAFNHMQVHLQNEREKNAAYEKARTDLIAGISHDLRTPLTSVKGFIKGLRDGVANTPEKQEQYLSIVYQKACAMDVLLQKLFDFSNLEAGHLPITPVKNDLGAFAREFVESVRDELSERNIKITAEITSVPHPVLIDIEQMRRVLMNLTENATRYAKAESPEIKIFVRREKGMEHLLFSDNGGGVLDEHLPHLFERFWRGDESRHSVNGDGSGLGLYICKYITEAHGGKITAKNGGGLEIQISLLCQEEETA